MKEKQKKRIISNVIFLLAVALVLCKLIFYINEIHLQKERFTQAETNAMRYIKEKYGFDANFSISDKNDKYLTENCGVIKLCAKYGDNEFDVIVKCDENSDESMDNFQYEEIKAALLCEIQDGVPEGAVINYSLSTCYSPVTEYYGISYFAFKEYFDGNNLNDVLKDCRGNIEMVFATDSVPELINEDKLKKWNIDYEFTSFDSKEHLDEFIDTKSDVTSFLDDYYVYKMYAPHITDHEVMKNGEKSCGLKFNFTECDDFIYSYFAVENCDFPYTENIEAVKETNGSVRERYDYFSEGEYVSRQLSGDYYFNCRYGDIYIYYPLEKLRNYDLENIGVAWYSNGGFSNNRNVEKFTVCGDYAVFYLPFHKMSFTLVDTSGYDEYVPGWAKK